MEGEEGEGREQILERRGRKKGFHLDFEEKRSEMEKENTLCWFTSEDLAFGGKEKEVGRWSVRTRERRE